MKRLPVFLLVLALLLLVHPRATAATVGIHLLHPQEIDQVRQLFPDTSVQATEPVYVTIPYSLTDLSLRQEWQHFFTTARANNIIPIVRLMTQFQDDVWTVPTRQDVVQLLESLDQYDWPQAERRIIIFNEPNHAAEWGGTVSPTEYADIFSFAASWAHTQSHIYQVLPAALDLSAPQSNESWDAYAFWSSVYREDPEAFDQMDAWNSHSYPNPEFSAAPYRTGRTSMQGFKQELAWLEQWRSEPLQVYITETGWQANRATSRYLQQYYTYALQHIWSDDRVIAVTPFVLKGTPGPFSQFSFLTADDKPTVHFVAFQKALASL
ncbi:MAG: hypothetical protein KDD44_12885, partial [Bdellovibrionales bacterium]|nr:hypothetical protein [Bdellovibrionales bacterium]